MPIPTTPPYPPLSFSLPKVSFRKIPAAEAAELAVPAGVHERQFIEYGFNNGSEFVRPEHYMRYIEPVESELKNRVEYDMDEQDQEWLDFINAERRRNQLDTVSYEVFEILMDRIEKEWFDLMKRVPKKATASVDGNGEDNVEDTRCAICDDGECENSNAIVFCDGCNLAAHQDCYGIPYIPEGQWLCRKCTVSPDRAVSCLLCPHEGGAFKQTSNGKWAHLLCAIWIPETGVSNPVYMEPIDSIEQIPKARWKLQCYLCRQKMGACIQCDNRNCYTAFHVTCAKEAGLLLKFNRQRADAHGHSAGTTLHADSARAANISLSDDEDSAAEVLRACCHKHLPKEVREDRERLGIGYPTSLSLRGDEDDTPTASRASTPVFGSKDGVGEATSRKKKGKDKSGTVQGLPNGTSRYVNGNDSPLGRTSKAARAYRKSYRAGPPLVPKFILDRVMEYTYKLRIRGKPLFVAQLARYWSLKREARRGAPLLKRLHLEPWTAAPVTKEEAESEKAKKLQFLKLLREDLERVRMLAELARKREREKLKQIEVLRTTLLNDFLFPNATILRKAFVDISSHDRQGLFASPVSREEVPDYYDIIKVPMDWSQISTRLDQHAYASVSALKKDVDQVLFNARLYNKPDTAYHKVATRIEKAAEPVFEALDAHFKRLHQEENDKMKVAVQAWKDEQEKSRRDKGPALSEEDMERILDRLETDLSLYLEPEGMLLDLVDDPELCAPAGQAVPRHTGGTENGPVKLENSASSADARSNFFDNLIRQDLPPPPPPPEPAPVQQSSISPELASADTLEITASKKKGGKRGRSRQANASRASKRPRTGDADTTSTVTNVESAQDGSNGVQAETIESSSTMAATDEAKDEHAPEDPEPADKTAVAESDQAVVQTRTTRSKRNTADQSKAQAKAPKNRETSSGTSSALTTPALPQIEQTKSDTSLRSASEDAERLLAERRGQAGVEPTTLEVEDVTHWDTFKRFNTGWVLPEGSKRHSRPQNLNESRLTVNRGPKEVVIRTPSKGKGKEVNVLPGPSATKRTASASTDHDNSEAVDDALVENSSDLSTISSGESSALSDVEAAEDEQEGDGATSAPQRSSQRRRRGRTQPSSGRPSNGSVSLQRDRGGRPGRGSARGRSSTRQARYTEEEVEEEEPEESDLNENDDDEAESGLADGAEDEEDEDADGPSSYQLDRSASLQSSKSRDERSTNRRRGRVKVPPAKSRGEGDAKDFVDGTMVWAKITGYPFSPAVVIEPGGKTDVVPENVLRSAREPDEIHLVRFYGQKVQWRWVPTKKLRFMFDYEDVDQRLLKAPDSRTQHGRQLVREAYKLAKAEKE